MLKLIAERLPKDNELSTSTNKAMKTLSIFGIEYINIQLAQMIVYFIERSMKMQLYVLVVVC